MGRYAALMRRLNESASWLSDVSDPSDDEARNDAMNDVALVQAADGSPTGQQPLPDARSLCLAEMLNESATWIDCDISESDHEREPPALPSPAIMPYPAGMPVVSGPGPPRSFSC